MTCDRQPSDLTGLEAMGRDPQHLLACRSCRRLYESHRDATRALAALPQRDAPADWRTEVWRELASGGGTRRSPSRVPGIVGGIYAVCLAIAVVSVHMVSQGQVAETRAVKRSQNAVAQRVEQGLAWVEVTEAESALRFQRAHVVYAQIRALAPEAADADRALAARRLDAMRVLEDRYESAVLELSELTAPQQYDARHDKRDSDN